MPTYEYRCPACNNEFDIFQRMSDEPKAECPNCGATAERRLSGGAGFLFKGSGFYITDYRTDSYKKAADADKSGGSASKSGDKASSEKKDSTTKSESASPTKKAE